MRTSQLNRLFLISSLVLCVHLSQNFHQSVHNNWSFHQLYTIVGEYVFVTFTQAHLRFLSSFTLASYHVVTTFINISTFALHNYSPLFRECSSHHMPMHSAIKCISHSYLTLLWFLHLVTYILGSLTFKRMLDLWVYTHNPRGFIHSSFK